MTQVRLKIVYREDCSIDKIAKKRKKKAFYSNILVRRFSARTSEANLFKGNINYLFIKLKTRGHVKGTALHWQRFEANNPLLTYSVDAVLDLMRPEQRTEVLVPEGQTDNRVVHTWQIIANIIQCLKTFDRIDMLK